jgi:hypothetical protein
MTYFAELPVEDQDNHVGHYGVEVHEGVLHHDVHMLPLSLEKPFVVDPGKARAQHLHHDENCIQKDPVVPGRALRKAISFIYIIYINGS